MPRASAAVLKSLQEVRLTSDQDVPLDCTICLATLYTGDLACIVKPCGHIFCLDCISQWLQNQDFCPNCNCKLGTDSTSPRNRRYSNTGASSRSARSGREQGGGGFNFFGFIQAASTVLQAYDRVHNIVGGIRRSLATNTNTEDAIVTVEGREIGGVRLWQIGSKTYRLPAANEFDYSTIRDLEEQEIDDLEFLETSVFVDLYSYVGKTIHDVAMEGNVSWYKQIRDGEIEPVLPDRSYNWRPTSDVRIGFARDNLQHFIRRMTQRSVVGGRCNTEGTASIEIDVDVGSPASTSYDNIAIAGIPTPLPRMDISAAEIAKKIAYIVQVQGVSSYKPLSAIVITVRSSCLGWLFSLLGYLLMSPIFILCLVIDIIIAPIIPFYAALYIVALQIILPCCSHETFEEIMCDMCCPCTRGLDASLMECVEHHVKKCIISCDLDANRYEHAQRIDRIATMEQERGGIDPYGLNSLIEEGEGEEGL